MEKIIHEDLSINNEYLALLSQQCEEYDRVILFIKEIVDYSEKKLELSENCRHLLTMAFRILIKKKIKIFRQLEGKIDQEDFIINPHPRISQSEMGKDFMFKKDDDIENDEEKKENCSSNMDNNENETKIDDKNKNESIIKKCILIEHQKKVADEIVRLCENGCEIACSIIENKMTMDSKKGPEALYLYCFLIDLKRYILKYNKEISNDKIKKLRGDLVNIIKESKHIICIHLKDGSSLNLKPYDKSVLSFYVQYTVYLTELIESEDYKEFTSRLTHLEEILKEIDKKFMISVSSTLDNEMKDQKLNTTNELDHLNKLLNTTYIFKSSQLAKSKALKICKEAYEKAENEISLYDIDDLIVEMANPLIKVLKDNSLVMEKEIKEFELKEEERKNKVIENLNINHKKQEEEEEEEEEKKILHEANSTSKSTNLIDFK